MERNRINSGFQRAMFIEKMSHPLLALALRTKEIAKSCGPETRPVIETLAESLKELAHCHLAMPKFYCTLTSDLFMDLCRQLQNLRTRVRVTNVARLAWGEDLAHRQRSQINALSDLTHAQFCYQSSLFRTVTSITYPEGGPHRLE